MERNTPIIIYGVNDCRLMFNSKPVNSERSLSTDLASSSYKKEYLKSNRSNVAKETVTVYFGIYLPGNWNAVNPTITSSQLASATSFSNDPKRR